MVMKKIGFGFDLLFPDAYVKSAYAIDYKKIYSLGYRGIIFDIDGTLACQDKEMPDETKTLLEKIEKIGLKIIFLSNNSDERIRDFLADSDYLFVSNARKPSIRGYDEAVKKLGINKKRIICIGDQIFTDVLSANRYKLVNILVEYMHEKNDYYVGKRRWLEGVVLKRYKKKRKIGRIGTPTILARDNDLDIVGRNFCNIDPRCHSISRVLQMLRRREEDAKVKKSIAKKKVRRKLPVLVSRRIVKIVKNGKGRDYIRLQKNKVVNIRIASKKINKIVVYPGEIFSFWKTVGRITKKRHYKDGRIIINGEIRPGIGGGLCQLGHSINWVVLHSPVEIVELHRHSDSLNPIPRDNPDPFGSGTAVEYNYIDYRFKNTTDQPVQICVWVNKGKLYTEFRSTKESQYEYRLDEKECFYRKEGEKYFRNSKIYRLVLDKKTNKVVKKEKLFDNHSEVMYDEELIPKELIKK